MATAIIAGLLQHGYRGNDIGVVDPVAEARARLQDQFKVQVFAAPDAEVLAAQVLVLAVKPQQLADVAKSVASAVTGKLVISIAAGIRSTDLSRWLNGHDNIIRVMPNTPSLVQAGVAGLYAMPRVSSEDRGRAEALMRCVGEVVWVDEEQAIDAVTAVSGSGPAYVFYFIEALEQAARDLGLSADAARTLSMHTFSGAAKLALGSSDPPAILRAKVTSKGGTTERALLILEQTQVKQHIVDAVVQAAERARELADEFGQSR
ncbi:MAG: pyrroline-5-carboxylate reductase [Pseudomonadota bacterium]|nr:pyrroline-5-carboxylate reductase [Pseudomonadota bacterium]